VSGGFERLHYLLETAWDVEGETLSYSFLKGVDDALAFDTNPLYAVAHESIYCNGGGEPSAWAAETALRGGGTYGFDTSLECDFGEKAPFYFTGEMVFPFMFDEISALRPLKNAANILAAKTDWTVLYDADVLNENTVPVACASYTEDAFVDWDLANETAREILGARVWSTSEYMYVVVSNRAFPKFNSRFPVYRSCFTV